MKQLIISSIVLSMLFLSGLAFATKICPAVAEYKFYGIEQAVPATKAVCLYMNAQQRASNSGAALNVYISNYKLCATASKSECGPHVSGDRINPNRTQCYLCPITSQ